MKPDLKAGDLGEDRAELDRKSLAPSDPEDLQGAAGGLLRNKQEIGFGV
ncbi:MAG: hypothetical protein KME17_08085 [Cyanosarcina radialis HA8281-LM2]|jgi:hypothetical protein|nr:hypothetical protein [Cyanosarcina radialis HA8281-LM2]